MFRFVCVVLMLTGSLAYAGTPDDDVRDAAGTLAQIDFCDAGISKSVRAALTKRMGNRAAQINGQTIYEEMKGTLETQPPSVQENACAQIQQKFETN